MRLWIFERTASKRQTIALSQQTRSALDFHYRTVGGIAPLRGLTALFLEMLKKR